MNRIGYNNYVKNSVNPIFIYVPYNPYLSVCKINAIEVIAASAGLESVANKMLDPV